MMQKFTFSNLQQTRVIKIIEDYRKDFVFFCLYLKGPTRSSSCSRYLSK